MNRRDYAFEPHGPQTEEQLSTSDKLLAIAVFVAYVGALALADFIERSL